MVWGVLVWVSGCGSCLSVLVTQLPGSPTYEQLLALWADLGGREQAVVAWEQQAIAREQDAVAAAEERDGLIMLLLAQVEMLKAEVVDLRRQLGRDSSNSSSPPSKDSPAAKAKKRAKDRAEARKKAMEAGGDGAGTAPRAPRGQGWAERSLGNRFGAGTGR